MFECCSAPIRVWQTATRAKENCYSIRRFLLLRSHSWCHASVCHVNNGAVFSSGVHQQQKSYRVPLIFLWAKTRVTLYRITLLVPKGRNEQPPPSQDWSHVNPKRLVTLVPRNPILGVCPRWQIRTLQNICLQDNLDVHQAHVLCRVFYPNGFYVCGEICTAGFKKDT